jgi:hypothetical protein
MNNEKLLETSGKLAAAIHYLVQSKISTLLEDNVPDQEGILYYLALPDIISLYAGTGNKHLVEHMMERVLVTAEEIDHIKEMFTLQRSVQDFIDYISQRSFLTSTSLMFVLSTLEDPESTEVYKNLDMVEFKCNEAFLAKLNPQ